MNHQRGIALVLVLWLVLLLTAVVATMAYTSQVEGVLARRALDRVTLIAASEAALEMIARQLKRLNVKERPWADGRTQMLTFAGVELKIQIWDENGKIALNSSDRQQFLRLFQSVGLEHREALSLADSVLDYRDGDSLVRPLGAERMDYLAAGKSVGPKDAPFVVKEELRQVFGMTPALYKAISSAVSVHATGSTPDLRLAPKQVLLSEPGMQPDFVDTFLEARFRETSHSVALPTWPDGRKLRVSRGGGPIYTLLITAPELKGLSSRIELVIDTSKSTGKRPYKVLRRREM